MRILFGIAIAVTPMAYGKTVFEGYYRIMKAGQHIGFTAVQEELDPHDHGWTIRTMTQIQGADHRLRIIKSTETQNGRFEPMTAEFEDLGNGKRLWSAMKFTGTEFRWQHLNGNERQDEQKKINRGEFFLDSLPHVLSSKRLAKGKSFDLVALNENADHVKIHVRVLDEKKAAGKTVYQVTVDSPARLEEYWITNDGQVVFDRLPKDKISSVLVTKIDDAMGYIDFDRGSLSLFFGETPKGKLNLATMQNSEISPNLFDANLNPAQRVLPDPSGRASAGARVPASVSSKKQPHN